MKGEDIAELQWDCKRGARGHAIGMQQGCNITGLPWGYKGYCNGSARGDAMGGQRGYNRLQRGSQGAAMGWEGAAMSLQWVRCKGGMLGTYGGVQSKYSWGARGVQ